MGCVCRRGRSRGPKHGKNEPEGGKNEPESDNNEPKIGTSIPSELEVGYDNEDLVQFVRKGDVGALVHALPRASGPLDGLLHIAAEEGQEAVIEALIAAGADISTTDEDGQTPLHVAVAHGHVPAAECLSRQEPCATTFRTIAREPYCSSRVRLWRSCFEMRVVDKFLMTPLHLACEDGEPDMVALLLSRGGDQLVVERTPSMSSLSEKAPPKQGPGGTLESMRSSSSCGGSLLFIANRHSHSEAADLIRRVSAGEKLELPERLSSRRSDKSCDGSSPVAPLSWKV